MNTFILFYLFVCSYYVQSQFVGKSCSFKRTGEKGVCKNLDQCRKLIDEVKKGNNPLDICGVGDRDIVFCCPEEEEKTSVRIGGRISEIKCREYGRNFGTLLPEEQKNGVNYIVGGEKASEGKYPHMAALGYQDIHGNIHYDCGGSIISEKFVVTAAHCRFNLKYSITVGHVKVGVNDLYSSSDSRQDLVVRKIISHPEYIPPSKYHDIALLELETPIIFGPRTKPICLNQQENPKSQPVKATGWGLLDYGSERSTILQEVELQIYPIENCQKKYGTSPRHFQFGILQDIQLCIGSQKGNDTCSGDSGGPVQRRDPKVKLYRLIGITSFGKHCGIAETPSIYTKISHYLQWIESIVWAKS